MSLALYHRAVDIQRAQETIRLDRSDIGKIRKNLYEKSLKALPPPLLAISDDSILDMVDAPRIKWHPDVKPVERTAGNPECFGYYRYSTDKQQHSLLYQREIVQEYHSLAIGRFPLPQLSSVEFLDPDTSGKTRFFERRGGGQLARHVRPGDHVLCAMFDRFGRDAVDTLNSLQVFVRMKVAVHVIDKQGLQYCDPNHPNTIREIQSAAMAAEHERRMISFRTKKCVQALVAKGKASGAGMDIRHKKIPNPNYRPGIRDSDKNPMYLMEFSVFDAAVCEEIYRLWSQESWTVYEINCALKRRRVRRQVTGKPWDRDGIRSVIDRLRAERSGTYLLPMSQQSAGV